MDFSFSEQQEMLRKIARDFLSTECPRESVHQLLKDKTGYPPELWNKMAELGWTGLVIPEQYGGIEGSFLDLSALVEEMGRAALPGPLFSSLIGSLAILENGSDQQKEELLPKIASGEMILTLAVNEPDLGYNVDALQCQAAADGKDYVINGTKLFVENAHVADIIICAAKGKDIAGKEGISLFLVDAKDPNVIFSPIDTIAGDKQFKVDIRGARIPESSVLGEVHNGREPLKRLLEVGAVLKCAEMLGGAQQVMDMTVDYVKERVQFDNPIGSLQAIQHHCANMMIDLEGIRYITYLAAWKLNEGLPCSSEVATAKAWTGEAYQRICDLAHQCHGAIGFCEESDLPLYSKQVKSSQFAFGDSQFQHHIVAEAIGL